MENFESLKNKLTRAINESTDRNLLMKLWEFLQENKEINMVSEPESVYDSEQPMTEQEVEEYFKEETIELHPVYLKMIERGLDDIKNGRVHDNEDVEKEFDEWLKD